MVAQEARLASFRLGVTADNSNGRHSCLGAHRLFNYVILLSLEQIDLIGDDCETRLLQNHSESFNTVSACDRVHILFARHLIKFVLNLASLYFG